MKIQLFILALTCLPTLALSQVGVEWTSRYNGLGNGIDEPRAIAVDHVGNVYVTGRSLGSGSNYDYVTIKYTSSGDSVWIRKYNGLGNSIDEAYDIAVDTIGNVYVTGWSVGVGLNADFLTIKYDANGDTAWTRRYNGGANGDDYAYSLAIDESGNVYVGGSSLGAGSGADYASIKYTASGLQEWVMKYNGPGNSTDIARAMTYSAGGVYVTGSSRTTTSSTSADYLTIRYNVAGDSLWSRRYAGPAGLFDEAVAIAVDYLGNVVVTGKSAVATGTNHDYATVKYDPVGNELWVNRYDAAGAMDEAASIAIDGTGNVFVTGMSAAPGTMNDYATIKYSSSGTEEWVKRYHGPTSISGDGASSVVVTPSGHAYVTGFSVGSFTEADFATIHYDPSGVEQWVHRYNSPFNGADAATAMALDDAGNVYATGRSVAGTSGADYLTIKYAKTSNVKPIQGELPEQFVLAQNFPNPFNPITTIRFAIPATFLTGSNKSNVSLQIFDLLGRNVATEVDELLQPGRYEVRFDASRIGSGVYFYRLQAGSFAETRKMVVTK